MQSHPATTKNRTGRKRSHGEGTISQRSDGRWMARITMPDGSRKALYGKTQKEVRDKLIAARHHVQQGLPLPSGRLTLATFLEQWLRDWVAPNVAPSTHQDYG